MFSKSQTKVKKNEPRLGQQGEDWGSRYLLTQGYRVVERNFRTRYGELDIVAERDGEYFFVEVKTRTSGDFGASMEAISYFKLQKLQKMATFYASVKKLHEKNLHLSLLGIDMAAGEPQFQFIKDIVE